MKNTTVIDEIAEKIETIRNDAFKAIESTHSPQELDQIRIHYLGKKGSLTDLLKELGHLSEDVRPLVGKQVNIVKEEIQTLIKERNELFKREALEKQLRAEAIDVTLPGRGISIGTLHPITRTRERLERFFTSIGFDKVLEGPQSPEIETVYYNFDALNMLEGHPARDMHDTFYFPNGLLLRTHTSPVQIRTMEHCQPPFRIITPGRVFRCDSDQTHTPMFHQLEGFVVDQNVNFSHLKDLIMQFLSHFFEKDVKLRFRPSYFPFTEPSAEVDIANENGWLEVLGGGMIHPKVLENVGIDSEKYTGFAFGIGIDRLAMLRYGVDDLRLFFENDIRFLSQL